MNKKLLWIAGLVLAGGVGAYIYYKTAAPQAELSPIDQPSVTSEDIVEQEVEQENVIEEDVPENSEADTVEGSALRETPPAVPTEDYCRASCQDQYGGGGSSAYDACVRACMGGEEVSPSDDPVALRGEACPSPGPACPSPQTPVCRDGKWYCREYAGGAASGAKVSGTVELNFPSDEELKEGACGEPALACEVPSIPECKNGKWICVTPATGGSSR